MKIDIFVWRKNRENEKEQTRREEMQDTHYAKMNIKRFALCYTRLKGLTRKLKWNGM